MIDLIVLQVSILLFALMIDTFVGEPPVPFHPVVWIGKVISFFEPTLYLGSKRRQRVKGTLAAIFTIFLFTVPTMLFQIAGLSLIGGNLIYLSIYVAVSGMRLEVFFYHSYVEKGGDICVRTCVQRR